MASGFHLGGNKKVPAKKKLVIFGLIAILEIKLASTDMIDLFSSMSVPQHMASFLLPTPRLSINLFFNH